MQLKFDKTGLRSFEWKGLCIFRYTVQGSIVETEWLLCK